MKSRALILMVFAFFLVMGLVDLVFIILSASSYPGTVTSNPYQKGMDYNNVMRRSKQQSNLGWSIKTKLLYPVGKPKFVKYELLLLDKKRQPINDAKVMLSIVRPLEKDLDCSVAMRHINNGRYQATFTLPKPGQWDLRLYISAKNHELYHHERVVLDE